MAAIYITNLSTVYLLTKKLELERLARAIMRSYFSYCKFRTIFPAFAVLISRGQEKSGNCINIYVMWCNMSAQIVS